MGRLANIPEAQAKSILIALCADDSVLERRALNFLGQVEAFESQVATRNHQTGTKRKAQSAVMICVQCQSPFHEEDNYNKACRYHDGNLEVDYDSDVWADHDENCHGPIDTDENRLEYPEGFVWSCCDKLGHRSGCTRGRHNALSGSRGRYGDTPGTCLLEDEESSTEESSTEDEESESDSDKSQDD
ncbi:hypothetical protein F4860DRAFT_159117 [Xylaria cubensis]|nr:hypothetical protein F4860DRAFT_159117 [Xylaria cubensis]